MRKLSLPIKCCATLLTDQRIVLCINDKEIRYGISHASPWRLGQTPSRVRPADVAAIWLSVFSAVVLASTRWLLRSAVLHAAAGDDSASRVDRDEVVKPKPALCGEPVISCFSHELNLLYHHGP